MKLYKKVNVLEVNGNFYWTQLCGLVLKSAIFYQKLPYLTISIKNSFYFHVKNCRKKVTELDHAEKVRIIQIYHLSSICPQSLISSCELESKSSQEVPVWFSLSNS